MTRIGDGYRTFNGARVRIEHGYIVEATTDNRRWQAAVRRRPKAEAALERDRVKWGKIAP
jgi:hypothetical protein